MVTLLVHDPWVQCYLVLVGTLSIAFIWDYLRNPTATRDGPRTPRQRLLRGDLCLPPPPDYKRPRRPVSSPRRWTEPRQWME
jgi:hypothetical protein